MSKQSHPSPAGRDSSGGDSTLLNPPAASSGVVLDERAPRWQPYREPLRTTLLRTGIIALVIGALLARGSGGGLARWPTATLLALWPALGGHCVELWFLNWLRPRLPITRAVQAGARVAAWFVGGTALAIGMALTATALAGFRPAHRPAWWLGGLAFIGIELVVHLVLQLRGRPSFYNGRG
jgi:hypothetical protein